MTSGERTLWIAIEDTTASKDPLIFRLQPGLLKSQRTYLTRPFRSFIRLRPSLAISSDPSWHTAVALEKYLRRNWVSAPYPAPISKILIEASWSKGNVFAIKRNIVWRSTSL